MKQRTWTTEDGNEYEYMSKEEADASIKEMGNMMEFFEGTCLLCGGIRMNCSVECIEKQLKEKL